MKLAQSMTFKSAKSASAIRFPPALLFRADALEPSAFIDHFDAELACLVELRPGAWTGHDKVGLARHAARDFSAEPFGLRLNLLACHLFQRSGEDDCLAGDGTCRLDRLHRLRRDLRKQRIERLLVMRFGEEVDHGLDGRGPEAADRIKLGTRFEVAAGFDCSFA